MKAVLLLAIPLALVLPTALALEATALPPADGPTNASPDGEFRWVCLGPEFVDCSVAFAFSAMACVDIPVVGKRCAAASVGGVGGFSSVGLVDGGAHGVVGATKVSCTWSGASGGCLSVDVEMGATCTEATATAAGYVGASPALLLAPAATATSDGCTGALHLGTVAPEDESTTLEAGLATAFDARLAAWGDGLDAAGAPGAAALLRGAGADAAARFTSPAR